MSDDRAATLRTLRERLGALARESGRASSAAPSTPPAGGGLRSGRTELEEASARVTSSHGALSTPPSGGGLRSGLRTEVEPLPDPKGRGGAGEGCSSAELLEALTHLRAHRERLRRRAEEALPGELLAPGVRRIRSQHPIEVDPPDRCAFEREPATAPFVFLDTETTGLAGGTGTLVFLLGLGVLRGRVLEVSQWLLTSPSAEGAWLDAVHASLPECFTLVSFNGKAFDLPLIAARARLSRRRDPFATQAHFDLLAPLRRAFATRWEDCRLQTAERRLLGHHRVDDLPGSFAPAAYHALLRQGDATLMRRMIVHHRQDVVSLARLLPVLDRVYREPAAHDADVAAIAAKWCAHGQDAQAERVLRASEAADARRALGRLLRRQRRDEEARSTLAPLVAGPRPCPQALESLAKIAEHRCRDAATALGHAERLLALDPANPARQRRVERLRRKCKVEGLGPRA